MTRLPLALLLAAVAACGPGPALYAAEPVTPETVVDGQAREWPAALRPVPGESGLRIGLRRDGQALVVVVASDERQARRIALGGLTVWIDPAGGTTRALGVRYPAPPPLSPAELQAELAARRPGDTPPDDPLRQRFADATAQLGVTRGVVTQRAAPDGRYGGLEAAASWGRRGVVVEMRIPLAVTPGLLTVAPADAVALGVELLDARRPMLPARGRRPAATTGPLPTGDRPDLPAADIATVTRWLRLDW